MIKNTINVAIISTSLEKGGAERFASLLSFMIEKDNIKVYNIIVNDGIDYECAGEIFNLGSRTLESSGLVKKINKGILLHRFLRVKQVGLIIDNRPRNNLVRELFTQWIYGSRSVAFVVHSSKLDNYFPKSSFWSKFLYSKANKIVCVSNGIEDEVKRKFQLDNTVTIHNPYNFSKVKGQNKQVYAEKYILYFGRFDEKVKNFSLMLEAFCISKIYLQGFKLYLMGEGPDLHFIQEKTKGYQLDSFVEILPFDSDPFSCVQKAKFTILSSRYEGFPMSLIESLALGTPVVAVDCNSGPREIISNEYNGLLVENENPKSLAIAMNRFIDNSELYDFCKKNAKKSVEHLSLETISKQWEAILF